MKSYLSKFKNNEPLTILLIGSSITSQEWCHPNWRDWLDYTFRQGRDWDKAWQTKLINTARDGAKISHYLDNFQTEISNFKPDLVIESLGINSLIDGLSEGDIYQELRKLNKMILDSGSELATWSYILNNDLYLADLKKLKDIQEKISKELDYQFVDVFSELQKYELTKLFDFVYPWENKVWGIKPGDFDFLHCNVIGNQIIAEKLIKEIFKMDLLDDTFGTMRVLDLRRYLVNNN